MPLARVGEIELSYERAGSGPPLLMIMGMSGTFDHWNAAFLAELRRDFETIVYDHRGVGDSSRLEGPITIAQLAQDADGLLAALELESAHVLGISMGGMVAQELALNHPERIRALTLGCTYCGGEGSAVASEEVMRRLAEGMMSGDRERALRTGWEVNVSPEFAADDAAYARFKEIGLHRAVPVEVIMEQMRAITEHDTSARLPEIALPTLVIHGTLDQMLPVQNGRMIAGLIPHSHLEIFEGVGHLFFWEQPERAAELVRAHAAVHA
ncbi:MAG TPA: alpha/beta hydrolase [Solirubrobacteraceae bacterium]|jgi:pimeloyl-ACP methyl ester carboxylesterase|nr:alpha/beta hydrolase [Solirubrobacteraceae bacterium]